MLMVRYEIALLPASQGADSVHENVGAHLTLTLTHFYLAFISSGEGVLALFGCMKDTPQCVHGSASNHDKYVNLHLITFRPVFCGVRRVLLQYICQQVAALSVLL